MDDTGRALEMLRAAAAKAYDTKPELTEEYLALIHQVETLPQNAPGTDKTAQLRRGFAVWAHAVVGPLPRRR